MIPASLVLVLVLGIAIERLTRRRPVPEREVRGAAVRGAVRGTERQSELELDRFIADLKRRRAEDATQVVRSR